METLADVLNAHITAIGICGSRRPSVSSVAALGDIIGTAAVCRFYVGDAAGIDSMTRTLVIPERIVAFDVEGERSVGKLVQRSVRMVDELAGEGPRAVLVGLPDTSCPAGLVPHSDSRVCFAGQRNGAGLTSGTWKTIAYAIGHYQLRCLVYVPPLYLRPGAGWSFTKIAARPGWWDTGAA